MVRLLSSLKQSSQTGTLSDKYNLQFQFNVCGNTVLKGILNYHLNV